MSAGARGGEGDRGLGELGESERIGGSSVQSRPPIVSKMVRMALRRAYGPYVGSPDPTQGV
eukprot:scaffold23778_cov152-Isochrysis_galbana.AAC.1